MSIELRTYGDLRKLAKLIANKQTKEKVFSKGKDIAIDQILGFIPGASNVKGVADLAKAAFKKPDTKKTDTWLDNFDIDDDVSAIVDDTIENSYIQDLVKNVDNKSDDEELPNDFTATKDLQKYIANKHNNKTVTNIQENKKLIKLLLKELEETPKTFEEDPMEFILKKYVSLNAILTDLMTSSYREYVEAVYIVAPKPTTFKVVFKNGQHIFLTYMGPAYEASVAGKNYYLLNIGEKERCMLAISKILRGGNPIPNKGPEGAEQAADAANDQGEESTGELSASGEGGEEAGGGEEESLTENAKKIIKLILEQEIENIKNKDEEKADSNTIEKKNKSDNITSLSPKQLGFADKKFTGAQLYSAVKTIKISVVPNDNIRLFMKAIAEDIAGASIATVAEVGEIEDTEETISFNQSKKYIQKVRNYFSIIGTTFGEVLGAMYMAKKVNKNNKIEFPKNSNEALYDFKIDDYAISSKYKKGAAASLTKIIENYNKEVDSSKINKDDIEYPLYTILNAALIENKGAAQSYLVFLKELGNFNEKAKILAQELNNIFNTEELTIESIQQKFEKDQKNTIKNLAAIYKKIGIPIPKILLSNNFEKELEGEYYGVVIQPVASYIVSILNDSQNNFTAQLKNIINKTTIKQINMGFYLRESGVKFKLTSFSSPNAKFKFVSKISIKKPGSTVMGFQMT